MATVRSGVFLEAIFWIFEEGAALFHGGHRLWGFGEGLGEGYRPPLNERDVSKANSFLGARRAGTLFCRIAADSVSRDRRYYLK